MVSLSDSGPSGSGLKVGHWWCGRGERTRPLPGGRDRWTRTPDGCTRVLVLQDEPPTCPPTPSSTFPVSHTVLRLPPLPDETGPTGYQFQDCGGVLLGLVGTEDPQPSLPPTSTLPRVPFFLKLLESVVPRFLVGVHVGPRVRRGGVRRVERKEEPLPPGGRSQELGGRTEGLKRGRVWEGRT